MTSKSTRVLIVWERAQHVVEWIKPSKEDDDVRVLHVDKYVSEGFTTNGTFGKIVVQTDVPKLSKCLDACVETLSPGGQFIFVFHRSDDDSDVKENTEDSVKTVALSSGLIVQNVQRHESGSQVFRCSKPTWSAGASASLSLRKRKKSKESSTATKTSDTSNVWKVMADDIDADAPLVDESLLLDDALTLPSKKESGCGTKDKGGVRKPCKNCTCGLRDMDGKPAVSDEELKNVKSSCGNCHKGDAFRCASCPFLGKPAYKPGEKVELML